MDPSHEEGRQRSPGSDDVDDNNDDEEPRLSLQSLAALREFYAEQAAKETAGEAPALDNDGDDDVPENWQLSQFWYTEETAMALATEALRAAGPRGRVACVCAPSVFRALLRLRKSEAAAAFLETSQPWSASLPWESSHTAPQGAEPAPAAAPGVARQEEAAPRGERPPWKGPSRDVLLEFDERFAALAGDSFVRYDYRSPLDLAGGGRGAGAQGGPSPPLLDERGFSLVLLDPPYLAAECLQKVAVTARFLAGDKIVLCTGAVMSEVALRELGVRPCRFVPRHQHQLANEFRCFANYPLGLDGTAPGAEAGAEAGTAAAPHGNTQPR